MAKKKIGLKVGESPFTKRKGTFPIVTFKLIQHGKEIEPWKGKKANVMEWMRNSSAMLGEIREEIATFWRIDKNVPVYYEEAMRPDSTMNMAFFTAERDGKEYNVAARLLDKRIKVGDRVKLTIMGCCSIIQVTKDIDVEKEKIEEEEEEEEESAEQG